MMFTGKTKNLAVIGSPIEHSLSPAMQNAAIRAAGMDYAYVAFSRDLEGSGLADALGSLLLAADTHIAIAHAHAASVLHAQQLALHCICESLDALLLGDE